MVKTVVLKLEPEKHAAFKQLCSKKGVSMQRLLENVITELVGGADWIAGTVSDVERVKIAQTMMEDYDIARTMFRYDEKTEDDKRAFDLARIASGKLTREVHAAAMKRDDRIVSLDPASQRRVE